MRQTAVVRCPAGISVSFFHALRWMGEDMEKDRLIRFLLLLIVLCEPLCQPLIAFGVEGHIVKDDWTAKAVRSGYIPLQQRRTTAQKNSRHGTGIQSALRNGGEQAMDIGVCLPVNNFSGILIDMDLSLIHI